ncbi:MAG: glycosyltransferase family 4 protein [Oligoflexia bacterium]|nr:glycosyltransferase family 4 protein [Oligoflexia bacterium]
MKIIYDHQIFLLQKYGGISRYFTELIRALKGADTNITINAFWADNLHLNDLKKSLSDVKANINFHNNYNNSPENIPLINFFPNYKKKIFSLLSQHLAKSHLKAQVQAQSQVQSKIIYHPTYYNPYFLKALKGRPFVLTVYDMIHETFPHFFSKGDKAKEHKKTLLYRANKIIAISESTKRDILKFYSDLDENNIEVIHLGPSSFSSGLNSNINFNIKQTFINLPNRYILFVGQRDRYKNFNLFIKAIHPLLLNKNYDISLVCAGGGDFTSAETTLFCSLGISNKVFHYTVFDDGLYYLYKNALCFVFPSLYEGFGLPVLEAFETNTPAILSNTSSLPEVGGSAACYFNPKDEKSILDEVSKVIHDKNLRELMIIKGQEQLKKFSWKTTAQKTLNVYKNL